MRFWNIPVPEDLDDAVEHAIEKGWYISKADLIRDAVRKTIAELKVQH